MDNTCPHFSKHRMIIKQLNDLLKSIRLQPSFSEIRKTFLNSSHTSSDFALGVLPTLSMSHYESDNHCCIGQGKLHLCSERLALFYRRHPRNVQEKLFVYIIVIGLRILNKKEEISKIGSYVFLFRFHKVKRLKLNYST